MTKAEKRERAEELRNELDRLQNSSAARSEWIHDAIAWMGYSRKHAENALLKHMTFLQATINLYSK